MTVRLGSTDQVEGAILTALRDMLPQFRLAVRPAPPQAPWDFTATLRSGKTVWQLLVEYRSVGEPRYLAQAITHLTLAARKRTRDYPVIAAPYIGPEGERLCREAGVGYAALAPFRARHAAHTSRRSTAPSGQRHGREHHRINSRTSRVHPALACVAIGSVMQIPLDSPVEDQRPAAAGPERSGRQRRTAGRQGALAAQDERNQGARRDHRAPARAGGSEIGV